jgi:ABC-type glycerol-3-phosphate transport system substrate-binding protein
VRDKFGVWRIPGSDAVMDLASGKIQPAIDAEGNFVPYYGHGGWMGGIDAAAGNLKAAEDFLTFLSSPPVSLEIVCEPNWGAGPTRKTHLEAGAQAGWHNYRLSPPRTAQLIKALEGYHLVTLVNPAYRLRIANERDHVRVFAEKVRPALIEMTSAELALQDAAQAWDGLAKDRAARLQEYRNSLGLK